MKLQVGRNELLSALQSVIGVVERRQTLPVLSNFLIETQDDELVVTGTDLEIELESRARVQNLTPGKITVPARKLFDICRALPEGAELQLESNGDRATLKSGRSRYQLACLKADEYPAMGQVKGGKALTLKRGQLKTLIERTQFAMAQQDVRYYLNGMLLEIKPGLVRSVATDGHRLARYELELPEGAGDMPGVIVPRKTVGELRKLLDDADGAIDVALSDTKIQFGFNGVELTSKLIDGNFPPYERVIPSGNDKALSLEAKEFAQSVDRVSTISADKTRAVKLNLSKDKVTLSVVNPESGTATEDVGATYSAGALEIGFNARYLLDITSQIEGKEVRFLLSDAGSPAIIEDAEDARTLYVLMPLRV